MSVRRRRSSLPWVLALTAAVAAQDPPAQPQLIGRIVDENGKPLAGAAVAFSASSGFVDTVALLAKPPCVTDAAGRYAIDLPTGVNWGSLVVAAAGRQGCLRQWNGTSNGPCEDLLLMPGGKLSGRVRDEHGAPLAGVRIRVESSITERYSTVVSLLAGARSDGKGIFTVPCVPRTGMLVVAEADGYLTESRLVAQDSAVDLSLQKVGMVRGKVVDAAGRPVAGKTVWPVTAEPRLRTSSVISAADGSFAITVPCRSRFRLESYLADPHRQLSSPLLHGPADDVVVGPVQAGAGSSLQVVVVDAATKEPIPKFHLSVQQVDAANLQIAMFQHSINRQAQEGRPTIPIERQDGQPLSLVVEAPGHAFEVVPVPATLDQPLTVAMGPEAVLVGNVIDEGTGKPAAGVAVRALPKGNSSGSGGTAANAGPLTDALGNYRIGGLRAGEYGVQTHMKNRAASPVAAVTVQVGTETKLGLTVPKEAWLEFELTGTVPEGVPYSLSLGASRRSGSGGFEHALPAVAPVPLTRAGRFRLGPVAAGTVTLQLFAPSRTRVGSGTTIPLGEVRTGKLATIALPDLAIHVVRGRVELAADVPGERIAVMATTANAAAPRDPFRQRAMVAGVRGDGQFTIDLPSGAYCLQCVDLLTGIVFHTEDEDLAVRSDANGVTLKPDYHWLEVDCQPQKAGGDVIVQSFLVRLGRPRNGAAGAFLNSYGWGNKVENGSVAFTAPALQRWLVPAGGVEVKAQQSFTMLQPWSQGYSSTTVGEGNADVTQRVQRLTFPIPAPPGDEELMHGKD